MSELAGVYELVTVGSVTMVSTILADPACVKAAKARRKRSDFNLVAIGSGKIKIWRLEKHQICRLQLFLEH